LWFFYVPPFFYIVLSVIHDPATPKENIVYQMYAYNASRT